MNQENLRLLGLELENLGLLGIEIEELKEILKMLKSRRTFVSPAFPSRPGVFCSTCNQVFEGPMGYVCQHPNCPTSITCQ